MDPPPTLGLSGQGGETTNGQPEVIGRYRVRRELGRGMMGVVYLALDPDLGRDIALKVIQLPPGASAGDRTSFEQRFFAEAQSAARLTHPGIVIVHDVGRDTGTGSLYMALQLLPGTTLDDLIREKKKLDWPTALRIGKSVAQALQHAHSEGVVHRDIKPANIMILPSGEAKIMDFGIAKIETSTLTASGQFLGTPLYMSPEQAMAQPLDGRSDVFSLGSVIYEMLTGVAPFAGDSITRILFRVISDEPAPPSSLEPSLPAAIDAVLSRCLAKDLERRYRDAGTLARDLGGILDSQAPGEPKVAESLETVLSELPPPPPPSTTTAPDSIDWAARETWDLARPKRPVSRRRFASTAAIAALAALGLAIWQFWPEPPVARLVTETPQKSAPATEPPVLPQTAPERGPRPTPDATQPTLLVVDFEHSLKNGVLRIYVDDLKVVDQPFGGRVTRKVVGLEMRQGHLTQTLEVTPGRRQVRIQVAWDGNVKSEVSETVFSAGGKLRLKAKLGSIGGLRKNLSLEWS